MRRHIWFDPPVFRWPRVLVVALLGIAVVVAWIAHGRGAWSFEDAAQVVATGNSSSAPERPRAPASGAPLRPAVTEPAVAAARSDAAASAPATGETLACLAALTAGQAASDAGTQTGVRSARTRWLAALEASPEPRVRAAGLLWQARAAGASESEPERTVARDRLARLAIEQRDAVVYAFAMSGCEARAPASPAGACQLLSVDQWSALDAGNGAVWLAVAERAGLGTPAQAEALRRAMQTGETRLRAAQWLPLLHTVEPAGLGEAERVPLWRELLALPPAAPIGGAVDFCSVARVQDANRRLECENLATMLLERGDALAHLMAGRAIAEALGWPVDRLAQLRRESEALSALTVVPAGEAASCLATERRLQRSLEAARLGEVVALRGELARSRPPAGAALRP